MALRPDSDPIDPTLLSASADPWPALVALADQPPRRLPDGRWVVARPDDVATVLDSDTAVVVAPTGHPGLAEHVDAMARFNDGPEHVHRRALTEERLDALDPGDLRQRATGRTTAWLAGRDAVDVVPLARRVPAEALAEALGLPDPARAVDAVDLLVRALAPASDHPVRPADPTVARALRNAELDETATALLFQTIDATAALVVATLLADPAPPLLLTTRRTDAAVVVAGVTIPTGAVVVLVLGTAAGTDPDAIFGQGRHACIGGPVARALAAGVLDGMLGWGALVPDVATLTWQARPNLRLPVSLVVRRSTSAGPADGR